jgi:tetratricopeptide (TPR) repeat protein
VHLSRWFLIVSCILTCTARAAYAEPALVSLAEVRKRLDGLDSRDAEARRRARESIFSIGPDGTEAMGAVLAQMRETGLDPGVRGVLRAADVERAAAKGEDWSTALLGMSPSGVSYRTALVTACLVEALAQIGTTRAVRELILVARDQGGAFRPEVVVELQKLGERSIAALILASHDPATDVARWASLELETLGKKVPGDAVQTKTNQVLSDVLDAYGTTRDLDALGAVLSFVNSDRTEVRDAARRATLAYGDAALAKLREAYANLVGTSPPQNWTAADVARELFAQDDRLRLQDVYALMDTGLTDEAGGNHEQAVEAFEKVLARQPSFERRAEMVPAFVLLARSKEGTDRSAARAYYHAAARLSPDGPRAAQIASALDYLEAEDLLARGIRDVGLFRRASEEDPGNVKAREDLARLELEEDRQARVIRRATEASGVFAAIVACLVLFVGRRRSPEASR